MASSNLSNTFLSLPIEIRLQIYNHVIPICRLAPFPYLDAEWAMKTSDHRGMPAIFCASRKIYHEVTPLVYSKAILEVAPAQHGHMFFHVRDQTSNRFIPYSYARISNTFRFYRPEHLKLIRRAHIFSNQADVVDGSCYESLLQWLVEHTSVEHIQLSARPMTRIRGSATFDLSTWRTSFSDNFSTFQSLNNLRTVRIWTVARRPPWEYEKMMRLRCKATDGTLHPLQIYSWSPIHNDNTKGHGLLQLDPRWLTGLNDEPEKINTLEQAVPLIDRFMRHLLKGKELTAYKDNTRHFEGDAWVYQVILVSDS